MPRRARFTFENATYHILSRGNNKQRVFLDEEDFNKFIKLILFYKEKYNFELYHYVLMNNHYHLILRAKNGAVLGNLMKGLNLSYAKHFRRKYGGIGYLWQGRFKSFIIQDGKYILECGRYIELNPVRAGIVKNPEKYPWSSCNVYAEKERSDVIEVNPEYLGFSENIEKRKSLYKQFLKDGNKEKRTLERYFRTKIYGEQEFIEKLKSETGLKQVWSHSGRPKKNKSVANEKM